jgi:biotin transport system substrate-specific component
VIEMSNVRSETVPQLVAEQIVVRSWPVNVLLVVAASFIIALSAQIAIPLPFTAVPMTLQPLAVLLVGAALGSRAGFAAVVAYLVEGASGLPVFAEGHGGMLWLFAPSAGFLYAFPFAAAIAGFASERGWMKSTPRAIAAMIAAIVTMHLGGFLWLAFGTGVGASQAFALGNAPFILGDAVKAVLAAVSFSALQKRVTELS